MLKNLYAWTVPVFGRVLITSTRDDEDLIFVSRAKVSPILTILTRTSAP
jgi:hypothetical protein